MITLTNLNNLISTELSNRDLDKTFKDLPSIDTITNITTSSKRLLKAIKDNESIILIYDLDSDGLSSFSLMHHYFRQINFKNYKSLKYSRNSDGYGGCSENTCKQITDQSLAIFMDIGTSSNSWVDRFNEQNIDTIIIDHHLPSNTTLPETPYIVNTNSGICDYSLKSLCAGSTTFLFLVTLNKLLDKPVDMNQDLLAIATLSQIGDMTLINGIYRPFIKLGLDKFSKSTIPYLQVIYNELFSKYRKVVTSTDISFSVIPLFNSTHRLDMSYLAIKFIGSKTYSEALNLFKQLQEVNLERKNMTKELTNKLDKFKSNDKVVVLVVDESTPKGLTGLIANQLMTKYNKPALVYKQYGDELIGSGRSPNGIPLLDIVNRSNFGKSQGHQLAHGTSTKQLSKLITYLNEEINLNNIVVKDKGHYLDPNDITDELVEILKSGEPYGVGNPKLEFNFKTDDYELVRKPNYTIFRIGDVEAWYFSKISEEIHTIELTYTIENRYKVLVSNLIIN
jgi:single-stranded-DNA-specific exonuclease